MHSRSLVAVSTGGRYSVHWVDPKFQPLVSVLSSICCHFTFISAPHIIDFGAPHSFLDFLTGSHFLVWVVWVPRWTVKQLALFLILVLFSISLSVVERGHATLSAGSREHTANVQKQDFQEYRCCGMCISIAWEHMSQILITSIFY